MKPIRRICLVLLVCALLFTGCSFFRRSRSGAAPSGSLIPLNTAEMTAFTKDENGVGDDDGKFNGVTEKNVHSEAISFRSKTSAQAGDLVLSELFHQLRAPAHADRPRLTVFHHESVVFDRCDVFHVDDQATVAEQKARVGSEEGFDLGEGHAAVDRSADIKADLDRMSAGDGRYDTACGNIAGGTVMANGEGRFRNAEKTDGLVQNAMQRFGRVGLDDVVERMDGKRLERELIGRGDEDDEHAAVDLAQAFGSLDAVQPIHADIEKDEMERAAFKPCQQFLQIIDDRDIEFHGAPLLRRSVSKSCTTKPL